MDDAVYCPGMWKQILVWHLVILFLRVIVIQSKLRSHKSRDTWKSKAKARRQMLKVVLVSILTTSALLLSIRLFVSAYTIVDYKLQ